MTTQISTQSQLSTFNFENSVIRVIAVNGEPWFIVKDICDALNLSNPTMAIANLDEDEKMVVGLSDTPDPKLNLGSKEKGVTSTYTPNLKLGSAGNGAQSLSLVSESGMYTLILRCREAVKKGSVPHRFRKWVTAEVLPQIRKTGQYLQKTEQIAPLALPEKPRKIQGTTRAAEGEYLYTREFSALEIDQLADLWDVAEQQYNFILSLIPLFESMQSEHWLKKLSIAKSAFETPHMSYPVLAGICEDIEEYTGMSPSIRLKKRMERRFSRF